MIFIHLEGVLGPGVKRPVAACDGLWQPVAPCGTGVRPLKKELLDLVNRVHSPYGKTDNRSVRVPCRQGSFPITPESGKARFGIVV